MMYSYECQTCGAVHDHFKYHFEYTKTVECVDCGKTAVRIFLPGRLPQVSTTQPFVTSDITGQPVEITSRKQEMDLCRRYGRLPVGKDEMPGKRRPKAELPPIEDDYQRLRQKVGEPTGDRAVDLVAGRK